MYRKVDESFEIVWYGEAVKLVVEQQEGCTGCFFSSGRKGCTGKDTTVPFHTGNCFSDARGDKASVIFMELTDGRT